MSKQKARQDFVDPVAGPVFSARFVIALVLIVAGHRLDRLLLHSRSGSTPP